MKPIYVFLLTLFLLLILDFLWLNLIAKDFYHKEFGSLLRDNFNIYTGILTYILITLGIFLFVIYNPSVTNLKLSLIFGAVLGLIIYGVYDLTNFSILEGYTLKITLVDIVWGTFLCSTLSIFGKYISSL